MFLNSIKSSYAIAVESDFFSDNMILTVES
jgi:hypothetical protein